jgi:hypothetical protein
MVGLTGLMATCWPGSTNAAANSPSCARWALAPANSPDADLRGPARHHRRRAARQCAAHHCHRRSGTARTALWRASFPAPSGSKRMALARVHTRDRARCKPRPRLAGLAHDAGRRPYPKELMMRILFLLAILLAAPFPYAAEAWPEIGWDALLPKDWDPSADFKNLDLSTLQDSDPKAMEALDKLKAAWDTAPAEPAMNGKRGRIAGFVLPLERQGEKVTEFLIVPYLGACLHTPPPPANQIIQPDGRRRRATAGRCAHCVLRQARPRRRSCGTARRRCRPSTSSSSASRPAPAVAGRAG